MLYDNIQALSKVIGHLFKCLSCMIQTLGWGTNYVIKPFQTKAEKRFVNFHCRTISL